MSDPGPGHALYVHGRGVLNCLRCGRWWEQEDQAVAQCCGTYPAIYDEVYDTALETLHDDES